MIFDIISKAFGLVKVILYKALYFFRISLRGIPMVNGNIRLAIKKGSKIQIAKGFKCRNNVCFRVYDNGKVLIGKKVFMNDGVSISCRKKITIGDGTIIGQNVLIFDNDHDYRNDINSYIREDVIIGKNVWIGANVVILKGVTIGDNAVIGASTVVRHDVKENSVCYDRRNNVVVGIAALKGDS